MVKWVTDSILGNLDDKQFGGIPGSSNTDSLVEMVHKWYETTDQPGKYVRVLLVDYTKAFVLIKHLQKLQDHSDLPKYTVRWMAGLLLEYRW